MSRPVIGYDQSGVAQCRQSVGHRVRSRSVVGHRVRSVGVVVHVSLACLICQCFIIGLINQRHQSIGQLVNQLVRRPSRYHQSVLSISWVIGHHQSGVIAMCFGVAACLRLPPPASPSPPRPLLLCMFVLLLFRVYLPRSCLSRRWHRWGGCIVR